MCDSEVGNFSCQIQLSFHSCLPQPAPWNANSDKKRRGKIPTKLPQLIKFSPSPLSFPTTHFNTTLKPRADHDCDTDPGLSLEKVLIEPGHNRPASSPFPRLADDSPLVVCSRLCHLLFLRLCLLDLFDLQLSIKPSSPRPVLPAQKHAAWLRHHKVSLSIQRP